MSVNIQLVIDNTTWYIAIEVVTTFWLIVLVIKDDMQFDTPK